MTPAMAAPPPQSVLRSRRSSSQRRHRAGESRPLPASVEPTRAVAPGRDPGVARSPRRCSARVAFQETERDASGR